MPWNCAACTFTNHDGLTTCEVCETPHRTYAQIVTGTRVTASVDDSEFLKAADILSSLSQVDQPVYKSIMLLLHNFTLSFHSVLSLSGSFISCWWQLMFVLACDKFWESSVRRTSSNIWQHTMYTQNWMTVQNTYRTEWLYGNKAWHCRQLACAVVAIVITSGSFKFHNISSLTVQGGHKDPTTKQDGNSDSLYSACIYCTCICYCHMLN